MLLACCVVACASGFVTVRLGNNTERGRMERGGGERKGGKEGERGRERA